MKLADINIRDPFILPVKKEQRYYLYGTTAMHKSLCFEVWSSTDLIDFEGPYTVFLPHQGFRGTRNFWAPEVYELPDGYYMFATFGWDAKKLGTWVLKAASPLGPFKDWSKVAITPDDWVSLDGTLHIDDNGTPWMVFCHEWGQINDGTIERLQLTPDLSRPAGEPVTLFHASEAPWVVAYRPGCYVTDGPFLFRDQQNQLCMLWSSFDRNGYAMGLARAVENRIDGPWTHEQEPIVSGDGGHGMIFHDFSNRRWITFHSPNQDRLERARFHPFPTDMKTL